MTIVTLKSSKARSNRDFDIGFESPFGVTFYLEGLISCYYGNICMPYILRSIISLFIMSSIFFTLVSGFWYYRKYDVDEVGIASSDVYEENLNY